MREGTQVRKRVILPENGSHHTYAGRTAIHLVELAGKSK